MLIAGYNLCSMLPCGCKNYGICKTPALHGAFPFVTQAASFFCDYRIERDDPCSANDKIQVLSESNSLSSIFFG